MLRDGVVPNCFFADTGIDGVDVGARILMLCPLIPASYPGILPCGGERALTHISANSDQQIIAWKN